MMESYQCNQPIFRCCGQINPQLHEHQTSHSQLLQVIRQKSSLKHTTLKSTKTTSTRKNNHKSSDLETTAYFYQNHKTPPLSLTNLNYQLYTQNVTFRPLNQSTTTQINQLNILQDINNKAERKGSKLSLKRKNAVQESLVVEIFSTWNE